MNKKKLRIIKKAIYRGADNYRDRQYRRLDNGQIVSDLHRSVYRDVKKECRNMTRQQVIQFLTRKEK